MSELPCPEAITDEVTFKNKLDELNKALWDTIDKHIDTTKPSPYSKRWWLPKLTSKKSLTTKMGQIAKKYHLFTNHPIHEEYREQHNKYANLIKEVKVNHWEEWLEDINESDIWNATRFISSPPSDAAKAHIPMLQVKDPQMKCILREAATNRDKGVLLHKTFFPPANPNLK